MGYVCEANTERHKALSEFTKTQEVPTSIRDVFVSILFQHDKEMQGVGDRSQRRKLMIEESRRDVSRDYLRKAAEAGNKEI